MTTAAPKVSVIMPVFNGAADIRDAITSVLSQTYANTELIIVDDGSTDGTDIIAGDFVRQDPRRVRYIFQKNGGVSRARNTGIQSATGDYIAFLDADDQWLPYSLELRMGLFRKHPKYGFTAVFSDYYIEDIDVARVRFLSSRGFHKKFRRALVAISEHDFCFNETFYETCLRHFQPLFIATVIVHKDTLDKLGHFPEDIPIAEDLEVWLRFCKHAQIGFVDIPLAVYYRRRGRATANRRRALCWNILLWRKILKNERSFKIRWYISHIISRQLNGLAAMFIRADRYQRARALYLLSLRQHPLNYWAWRGIIKVLLSRKTRAKSP